MTTPNAGVIALAPGSGSGLLDTAQAVSASQAGAPDPAWIAQLANTFFSSLPGQAVPVSAPSAADVSPQIPLQPAVAVSQAAPVSTPTIAPSPSAPLTQPSLPTVGAQAGPIALAPTDKDLRGVPATLGGVLSLVPPLPGASFADGFPAGANEPQFYFLKDAQPQPPTALPAVPQHDDPVEFGQHVTHGFSEGVPATVPSELRSPSSSPRPQTAPSSTAVRTLAGKQAAQGGPGAIQLPRPFAFDELVLSPAQVSYQPDQHLPSLAGLSSGTRAFNPQAIRNDFPLLREQVHGRPLIWLDNAATTQKPQSVIDRISYFYQHENSNIHRAAHALAARATDAYEAAREKVRAFLNASSVNEIIFVRGTTEGINLIAKSWGQRHIGAGDEIIVSHLEHHANIVPWQQLAAATGAKIKVAPVDDDGQVLLDEYEKLFTSRTKLVSFTQVSNALGTITPIHDIVKIAHRYGARVLVDGAQAVSHMRQDVQAIGADFYVFSGHKVFGPTGIGVVYGTQEVLEETPPWQGGGNMIADVTFEKTLYQPAPNKFEAGTGNIADAVGLGAALDYVAEIGIDNIAQYEHELLVYGTQVLQTVPGLRLVGTAKEKAGVLSFVLDGFKTEEVGAALDKEGIAVRSGHHCAQPILRRFGLEATVRPSLAPYNTCEDLDALVTALLRLKRGR